MPADFATLIAAGLDIITDFGLLPVIAAGAVVAIGTFLFSRVRAAAK
jgi:hypothetical protein